MKPTRILGLASLATVLVIAAPAGAQQLTISSAGGAWQKAQHDAWYAPFAQKMGIKFIEEETTQGMARIQAMVQAKNVTDVTTVDVSEAMSACDTGILERLDWAKIASRANFLPGAALDCGMALDVYGNVLAYNTDVIKSDPPTSVLALFDTKRWPGKRGMWKSVSRSLEWALEADGVPIEQVYKVLATPEGVDRAFRKLDTIKKDVVWWEAGAQPPQLLASHEVVMSTAWNGRIQNPIDKEHAPFKIVWDNQIIEYDMISIPKGSPHLDLAYKYLAYVAEPENNARLSQFIPYGPVLRGADKFVPAETNPKLPTAEDHLKNALVIDVEFWSDHGEDLTKRFNAWLAK